MIKNHGCVQQGNTTACGLLSLETIGSSKTGCRATPQMVEFVLKCVSTVASIEAYETLTESADLVTLVLQ